MEVTREVEPGRSLRSRALKQEAIKREGNDFSDHLNSDDTFGFFSSLFNLQ